MREINNFRNDVILKEIAQIARQLKIKVYLVGGAVRGLFLKEDLAKNIDWDFAVDRGALKLSRLLARRLNAAYVVLDRKRKTARVVYTKNNQNFELDFVDLRAKTLREDLKLRDFTINTLCLDLRHLFRAGEIKKIVIDYFGAVKDIKAKIIRMASVNIFKDDPLRILRGFAFCAQFNFKIEPKTVLFMKRQSSKLPQVPKERITNELVKIFCAKNTDKYITEMDNLGILKIIFPEITFLIGIDQGMYHHLDVWQHSLETLKQLPLLIERIAKDMPKKYGLKLKTYLQEEIAYKRPRFWLLKLACLMHDLGKPATRTETQDEKVHFYTHEKVGAKMVINLGRRLKLSLKEISVLKNMVLYHLRPGQLVNRKPSRRAKFRFFRDTQEEALSILLLALADRRAMQGVLSKRKCFLFLEDEIVKMVIEFLKNKEQKINPPCLLNGHELMNFLHTHPGPIIGKILKEIEEAQAIKLIKTKEDARGLALQIYKGNSLENVG